MKTGKLQHAAIEDNIAGIIKETVDELFDMLGKGEVFHSVFRFERYALISVCIMNLLLIAKQVCGWGQHGSRQISFRFGAKNQNMCATYLPFILPTLHAGKLEKFPHHCVPPCGCNKNMIHSYTPTVLVKHFTPVQGKIFYSWLKWPGHPLVGGLALFCGSGHRFNHGDTWRRLFSGHPTGNLFLCWLRKSLAWPLWISDSSCLGPKDCCLFSCSAFWFQPCFQDYADAHGAIREEIQQCMFFPHEIMGSLYKSNMLHLATGSKETLFFCYWTLIVWRPWNHSCLRGLKRILESWHGDRLVQSSSNLGGATAAALVCFLVH